MSHAGSLLVTGFPGFRAKALVRRLLEQEPGASATLLCHPARRAAAESALLGLAGAERVTLLEGDAAAIDFGLAREQYRALAECVTHVHHVYQVLDLGAPGELAGVVNVGGAREIIEFSRAARGLEHVVVHSSVFVSGDRTGLVTEDELVRGQSFRSPVAASLALAEVMLRRHPEIPLTVARAGQIVGDSRTGVVDQLDGVYPLLVFLASTPSDVALPLPPRADAPLHLVPVDYVAAAAHALGRMPQAIGKTVHLVDPRPLTPRRLLELAAERFGKRVEPGFNVAAFGRALLRNPGVGLLAGKLRTLGELVTAPASYDDRTALELLAGGGVSCPPLESYLDVLVSHVQARVKEQRLNDPTGKEAWDVAS